ncbi:MAG TPA: alpha/beta hydrolase, partial [Mycobacteriales bacterium]|nr:alpha/beta hydrolase [Mycobacteriales bacterium]
MPSYRGHDDAPLHYDTRGSGTPLIVLAGGAGRHPDYLGDLAGLDARRELVLPHLRGVGGSAGAPLASRWEQVGDVERLRQELGLPRCVLVGHSAGTRLALAYAARFPDRVAGLLLITPPAAYLVDVPSDVPALTAARRGQPGFADALAALEQGPQGDGDEGFDAWQAAAGPVGYASWNETTRAHASAGGYSLAAAVAFLTGDGPADLVPRLRAVTAPTLVIAGAADALVGVAPVVAVAGLFPHGRAVVLEDCGHYPWLEQ